MTETLKQENQNLVENYLNSQARILEKAQVDRKIWIPTDSNNNGNFFIKKKENWITCRDKSYYDQQLFYDEFINDNQGIVRPVRQKDDNRTIEGWSREDLLGTDRVVVDLGSGEAVALLQYSKEFPKTTFIGIDCNYQNIFPVDYKHQGVQLIKDDWGELNLLKDNSVDTFLSVQGGLTWSCEGPKSDRTSTPEKFLNSITRAAKENCFFLADSLYWSDLDPEEVPPKKNTKIGEQITNLFKEYGWERIVLDKSAFFILTKK